MAGASILHPRYVFPCQYLVP